MARYEFYSVFADEINAYIADRVAAGYDENSYRVYMIAFDRFCNAHGITEPVFTIRDASAWIERRDTEAHTTHYSRVNASKHFLTYLSIKGYNVYVVRDVKYKGTDFQPHIYTDDEATRYFRAVDSYSSTVNRKDALQYPVIFRILYCCGTRINETLGIKKEDVDLDKGIIRLNEAKMTSSAMLSAAKICVSCLTSMQTDVFTYFLTTIIFLRMPMVAGLMKNQYTRTTGHSYGMPESRM